MDEPTLQTSPRGEAFAFLASATVEADAARRRLSHRYGSTPPDQADVIVALGGDGFMLQTLHRFLNSGKPIYGMHQGSIGFLMNEFREDGLVERIATAKQTAVRPLAMRCVDQDGTVFQASAFNEVSLWRQTYQASKLRILIDDRERLPELICDGVIVATPAGSTAYNLSAHGPIIPLGAPLMALTPISPFRPRRWRGALVPDHAKIRVEVLEPQKRPVSVAADHAEFRNIVEVEVQADLTSQSLVLFDSDHSWEERILAEQFRY